MTKTDIIIGQTIDYGGLGVLREQRYISSKNWPKYSPRHESYLRNNLTLNGGKKKRLSWPLPVGNWGSNNKRFQYTSADVGHTRSSTSGTIL